jgi:amidohydrolase/hippurate hydrolase
MESQNLMERARDLKPHLTRIRRDIHRHPEIGFQEVATTERVRRELTELGVEVVPLKLRTGLVGLLRGERNGPGPVTALRADLDALPVTERTGLSYASSNEGVMHACGHDGNTTMLLGAARLLAEARERFSGAVKFLFQPAEEIFGGAEAMIEAGCLQDPPVDRIVALHGWPDIEVGKVGIQAGPHMASADRFEVRVRGAGGHGAYPHLARDPVTAAAHVVTALQAVISRETDPMDRAVLSVCTMEAGSVFNVIPDEAVLGGTARCENESVRRAIRDRVGRVARGIAGAMGCEGEVAWTGLVPPLVNDEAACLEIAAAAEDVLGPGAIEAPGVTMGSEDFALYLERVPRGALIRIGLGVPGKEAMRLHNNRFDFNDDALPVGAALLARLVLRTHGPSGEGPQP